MKVDKFSGTVFGEITAIFHPCQRKIFHKTSTLSHISKNKKKEENSLYFKNVEDILNKVMKVPTKSVVECMPPVKKYN